MTTDELLSRLAKLGWESGLTRESLDAVADLPLRGDSFELAAITCELAIDNQPITVRGLFYRVVSAGFFPGTDDKFYNKFQNLLVSLRRHRLIPYPWIVDNIRGTIRPNSWSGLEHFADTMKNVYRKHFWAELPVYPHAFVEKDAMSGVLEPVTRELDVALSPVRGYVSDSFAWSIGNQWKRIKDKRIVAIYIGDFDPSGFDLERSLREKLAEFSGLTIDTDDEVVVGPGKSDGDDFDAIDWAIRIAGHPIPRDEGGASVTWKRIALNERDIADHGLHTMRLRRNKRTGKFADTRAAKFFERYGDQCCEVDALPPGVIRERLRDEIMQHVPSDEWERLKEVEAIERETWEQTIGTLRREGSR